MSMASRDSCPDRVFPVAGAGTAGTGPRGVPIVAHPPWVYNSTAVADTVNLTHHFLIAMPAMADPHFANTLTYVCEHNEDGALGIVTWD